MSQGRIEHVNLTVTDNERSAAFFEKLLGWYRRWAGKSQMGGTSIHMGEDATYLALYSDGHDHSRQVKGVPMNHVGFLVGELDAAGRVVIEAGLKPVGQDEDDPGRRLGFFDWGGSEFLVVSYE
jgi:predicted enzyme related to lactoylglutathione lyase